MSLTRRIDIDEAIDEACATYRDNPGGGQHRADATTSKARDNFVRRLKRFLTECPEDVTISELRDELDC